MLWVVEMNHITGVLGKILEKLNIFRIIFTLMTSCKTQKDPWDVFAETFKWNLHNLHCYKQVYKWDVCYLATMWLAMLLSLLSTRNTWFNILSLLEWIYKSNFNQYLDVSCVEKSFPIQIRLYQEYEVSNINNVG